MRKVNYLGMNGNEQLLLGKMTFFTPASIQVQAHYVYDISIVWAAGVWFLCNVTVLNPWALISVKSSSQRSSALFCPKQEHLIPLSAGTAHEPAARSSVCQCAADLFQLELHSFLFQSEICTCMLDCAPLVFWLVFSPPALIICLTLAFQDCLSPKVMCVDWRISSKLKCDWCSVARRNSSAKCRWASLQLYTWSQAYTQVHTFSILHV